MARCIDTSAHIDALPFDTVAILAGGVRIVYPREDVDLHAPINKVRHCRLGNAARRDATKTAMPGTQ